jgi:hypothetical protein
MEELLKEKIAVLAEKLGMIAPRASELRTRIKKGVFGARLSKQFKLLYKHYGLTPNDVIDYGQDKSI